MDVKLAKSMISRLESGDHVPSVKTLCRIADAFGRRLEIAFHEHEHEHADGNIRIPITISIPLWGSETWRSAAASGTFSTKCSTMAVMTRCKR